MAYYFRLALVVLGGFCLVFLPTYSFGQNQVKIDSLENLLKSKPKNKAEIYLALSQELAMFYPQKARTYAQKGLKISKEHTKHQAQSLKTIGLTYYFEQKNKEGRKHLRQALKIFQKIQDQKGESAVLHNIGLCYQSEGNLEKALNYFLKSLKIEEKIGNKSGLTASYANVAMVLEAQLELEQALYYYQKALDLAKESQNAPYQVQVYFNIAHLHFEGKDYQKAKKFADSTLVLAKKIQMPFGIAKAEGIRADLFWQEKRYEEALVSIAVAERIFATMQARADLLNLAIIKAKIYEKQGKFEKMKEYAEKAKDLGQDAASFDNSRKIYYLLYKSYKALGQKATGLEYLEKYMSYKDSIFVKDKNATIQELVSKYETEKKEQKIRTLKQDNQIQALEIRQKNIIILASVGLALLALLVFYLFYRQKQLHNQKKQIGLEQKLLRTQLNPHFIFNALNAIQDYILKMDKAEASTYLAQFAQLMRQILENSRADYITLEQEIETLENYLSLQQLRFEDKFDYNIELENDLDSEEIQIPPMFAQPFIENAIEHGIAKMEGKGEIQINFRLEGKQIILEIADSGIGMEASAQMKTQEAKKHKSLASIITQERIEAFRKSINRKITFQIERQTQGTKVVLYLPYQIA